MIRSIFFRKVFFETVLCFLLVVVCYSKGRAQSPVDSSRVIRVLTYNIHHGENIEGNFDLNRIAEVIRSVKPDLVALQEVDFFTNRVGRIDLATELGRQTKLAPLFGQAMLFDGGGYGVGILSGYPFLNSQTHALPGQEGREPRTALEAQVILNTGDTIRFVSTHLDHQSDKRYQTDQAVRLNELFTKDGMLSILSGDLNARPESETMGVLFNEWTKSFADNEPTSPSTNPRSKIDYILYRPASRWRVLETRVIDERLASDHLPVLSVLEILPAE